jgi:hypothetical protein
MDRSASSKIWIPSLHGCVLPPHPDLNPPKSKVPDPNSDQDRPWSYAVLRTTTPGLPRNAGAIWLAIVAIWQLRRLEVDGKDDVLWGQHIAAWLVRWNLL